jgi:hypothetical protein
MKKQAHKPRANRTRKQNIKRNAPKCDHCKLPMRTMIYLPDAIGWPTHVLSLCSKHSGTKKLELYVGCNENYYRY